MTETQLETLRKTVEAAKLVQKNVEEEKELLKEAKKLGIDVKVFENSTESENGDDNKREPVNSTETQAVHKEVKTKPSEHLEKVAQKVEPIDYAKLAETIAAAVGTKPVKTDEPIYM